MLRLVLAAGMFGCLAFSSGYAWAIPSMVVAPGSSAPAGTTLLQINSDFTSPTGTAPYGAASFSLDAYVPDQVSYYPPDNEDDPEIYFDVSGTYTDNGATTQFSNQQMWIIDQTYNNAPSSLVGFSTSGFLQPGDGFDIYANFTGWLFSAADIGNGDSVITLNSGVFSIDPNIPNSESFANYYPPGNYLVHDMQFQGGAGVSIGPVAVPEPGSAALLFTGMLGLGMAVKRRRQGDRQKQ